MPVASVTDHNEEEQPSDKLLILFASQTGTAEDVAQSIARQARRRHYPARVSAIDDYELANLLEEPLVIFVTATTGQGDEPANMRKFWQFLKRADLPSDLFDHCLYTIFGLGDSTYPKFNWPAKKLDRRLEDLGGRAFYERGEADDQDYLGIDTVLDKWLEGLWTALAQIVPPTSSDPPIAADILPPARLRVSFSSAKNQSAESSERIREHASFVCTITRNERATSKDHFQDTRYFEMAADSDIDYQPGDVAELRPENAPDDVDKFLRLMKWQDVSDLPIEILATSEDWPLPSTWPISTTLRSLFTKHLDMFSVPRRSFFEALAYFTTNADETEKLREFCSATGQEDLWDYANRPKRTIYEVLTEFKSASIPIEYIADVFPEMRPRQFSIASCLDLHPRQIHLLVAIVSYKTIMHKPRRGVCTSWIAGLKEGDKVPVSITRGTLIPPSERLPAIFIGPGTGIAPFRAFAEQRRLAQAADTVIFFGCRSTSADFYYADEWERATVSGNVDLVVAASRDQENKVYVQHKIVEKAEKMWRLVDAGASIYISGSANKMPDSVRKAFKEVFRIQGQMSEPEAAQYLENLESTGRFQEETWS